MQAGNRADWFTAPTLANTHNPHVEEIPTFADLRTCLRPALEQPAQHAQLFLLCVLDRDDDVLAVAR